MKILAIDIGGTSIKVGLTDVTGNITHFKEYDSESKQGGPHVINRLIEHIEQDFSSFDCIGISTAGQVDSEAGSIIFANENIPKYTGMKVKQIFEDHFHVPVKVENDVNAAALGEMHFGAAKDFNDFLCLTYGTGIGGAIITDRKLYKGETGSAAEFGHMILHPEGKECPCGALGCYEVYGSTTALVKEAMEIHHTYINGRQIFKGLEAGDARMEEVLQAWASEVAYGLVTLIHIFNPPAIIIGGGVMEQDQLVSLVADKVAALIMQSFSKVKILKASLGNKAGLLGAGSLHLP